MKTPEPCKDCVHFVQSLIQNPDTSFRKTKHGLCAVQSTFSEDDNTPGIPADVNRVGPHEVATKKVVWADTEVPNCTLRITRAK